MPIKLKPSSTTKARGATHSTTTHYYAKRASKQELFDYINKESTPNKLKQKCRNELVRRNIKTVFVAD